MLDFLKYVEILKKYLLPFTSTQSKHNQELIHQNNGCQLYWLKRAAEFFGKSFAEVILYKVHNTNLHDLEKILDLREDFYLFQGNVKMH